MLIPTLLYHDVVPAGEWTSSGFTGGGTAIYKMEREDFGAHVACLAARNGAPALVGDQPQPGGWRLTFDDGGISALTEIAPVLGRRGWKAHFFMTTGCIGAPGFLDADGLRALAAEGHVIGSHTVTHPIPMSACPREQLVREWEESADTLAEILGTRPRVASIPGGAFSRTVAETAGEAGIRILFTSEPTARMWNVGPVLCLGRFTLWRGMGPAVALSCLRRTGIWPLRQRCSWETKKAAKAALGPLYLGLRSRLLAE